MFDLIPSALAIEINYPDIPGFGDLNDIVQQPIGFQQIVQFVFAAALWFGFTFAFLMLIWAGVQLSLSAGNPGKRREVQDRLAGIVFGMLMLLTVYIVLRTINPDLIFLKTDNFAVCQPRGTLDCSNPLFPSIGGGPTPPPGPPPPPTPPPPTPPPLGEIGAIMALGTQRMTEKHYHDPDCTTLVDHGFDTGTFALVGYREEDPKNVANFSKSEIQYYSGGGDDSGGEGALIESALAACGGSGVEYTYSLSCGGGYSLKTFETIGLSRDDSILCGGAFVHGKLGGCQYLYCGK